MEDKLINILEYKQYHIFNIYEKIFRVKWLHITR
jgi:hypothetical protein